MYTTAVLVYVFAIGAPVLLLRHFHPQAWYWHVLAIAAAVAIGLMPNPLGWDNPAVDLVFGLVIVMLLVWGVGGLMFWQPHRHKHA